MVRNTKQNRNPNSATSGGMMFGMGVGWLLVIVLLVLAIAALVKYLRK